MRLRAGPRGAQSGAAVGHVVLTLFLTAGWTGELRAGPRGAQSRVAVGHVVLTLFGLNPVSHRRLDQ